MKSCLRRTTAALVFSIISCSAALADSPSPDWTAGTVEATGRGFARPTGNAVKDELMALEAARTIAYARLAEAVHSVRVSSTTTVGQSIASGRIVETRLDGVVKGAAPVAQRTWRQTGADGRESTVAEITLRACLTAASESCRGRTTLASVVAAPPPTPMLAVQAPPVVPVPASLPPATKPVVPQPPGEAQRSGLLLRLGGQPFMPVMMPEIVAPDGTKVFSADKVRREIAANDGPAQYANALTDARKRPQAGGNPLIISAIKVTEDNRIVVSEADAKLIATTNQAAGDFMREGRVVIVMD